jgi:integrase
VKFERQTVAQFLARWLEDAVKISTKPKTYEQYGWAVNNHLAPGLGRHQLRDLAPQHVQRFINEKTQAGLKPKSVKALRDTLRAALNQALSWDEVPRNVAERVTLPRMDRVVKRVWSVAEAESFLTVASGHRLEGIFRLALCFGVRQGEILALRWRDVDFEARWVAINGTQQRVDGELISVDPKTPSSFRRVPFALGLGELLAARRRAQDDERAWSAGDWEETGIVFTSGRGTRLDVSNLARIYRGLVKRAGVEYIPFHRLRSTAASLLKERGLTDEEIAVLLGHSSAATTREFYLQPTPDSVARLVRGLESVFSPVAVSVAVLSGGKKPS